MSDLIDRDRAIAKTFCTAVDGVPRMAVLLDDIKAIPSARPKEGKWIWNENGMDWGIGCWCCSECGMRNPYIGSGDNALLSNPHNWAGSNFCPNCGADMRGAENGTDKDKSNK